jgi:cyclase
MLAALAPHTAVAPIALAINTHADGDHWWGNAELPAGCEVLASAPTLAAMRDEAPPKRLAGLARTSSASGRLPGRLGQMGRYVGAMLSPFAFDEVTLRFPDRTFTGSTEEVVGGRRAVVTDHGAAHTGSDSVVHVPDAGVVYAADLLFVGITPVMWHGPVGNWIAALEWLLALDAETFVPGHGPVAGRADVEALHGYWTWLAAAVAAHHGAGRGTLETRRRLIREPEFAAYRGWVSPERMQISVSAIHSELSGGGPLPTAPLARARIFDQVASLGLELAAGRV